ncbi:MAG: hypothetical protein PUC47_05515 [Oscillospiraceae bacterium]|nr:hypothetical protein [Oscillospiraceae bacterium]
MYEGLWISEVTDQYDYLEIDAEGNLQLYSDGYVLDEGYLWYDPEWSTTYIDSTLDGFLDGARIEMEGGQIYIDVCGYFDYLDGRGGQWQGAAGGTGGAYIDNGNNGNYGGNDNNGGNDTFYSWDSELCQRNVSEFEGTWYYNGDYSAMSYIVIDRNGNWSYYERAVGEAEATRMDYGTFSYSAYEVSTYYAESAQYTGLSTRVYEYDEGVIFWGDETYYRME